MNPYILLIFSYYSDMYIIVFNHTSKNVSSRLQWNCINRWYRMGKRKALILTSPINLLTFHTLPRENIGLSYHLNFAPCPCPSPCPAPALLNCRVVVFVSCQGSKRFVMFFLSGFELFGLASNPGADQSYIPLVHLLRKKFKWAHLASPVGRCLLSKHSSL